MKMATNSRKKKKEYGDWQTNGELAQSVCIYLKQHGVSPDIIIEPTCGIGNFVMAAIETFENVDEIYGIEIDSEYLDILKKRLQSRNIKHTEIHLINKSIFEVDFSYIKERIKGKNILVLGNPPWVTNSEIGNIGSCNIPIKTNFKNVKGLDAITGKGNFDIAEYITYQMMDLVDGITADVAFIIKNSVIKNIVYAQKNGSRHISDIRQLSINAQKEFGVSVAASLLTFKTSTKGSRKCDVYDFYSNNYKRTFGWINNNFVADCKKYMESKDIFGPSYLVWRSGLKHDCSKVMELTLNNGMYYNNLNENVDIEQDVIYPFLKSSDMKSDIITNCRKYIILTQHSPNEDTSYLKKKYPKTYKYLEKHIAYFNARKSSIYDHRPKFCLFGIGDYSFKKYKIVISGLYKQTKFSIVSMIKGKTVLVDDTTYQLCFDDLNYAQATLKALNSPLVQEFIQSIFFEDAKRPINKDLLMSIDLAKAIKILGNDYFNMSRKEFSLYKRYMQPVVELSLFA